MTCQRQSRQYRPAAIINDTGDLQIVQSRHLSSFNPYLTAKNSLPPSSNRYRLQILLACMDINSSAQPGIVSGQ
jgi:hypothetical protein